MATDKIYIVTLKKKEDLEGFYADMASDGYKLSLKRPISRNTHYFMEEEDAVEIRKDSRVIACERHPEELGITPKPYGVINNEPYGTSGQFRKSGSFTDPNDKEIIVSPKQGSQSIWSVIPCPGVYSLTINWSG